MSSKRSAFGPAGREATASEAAAAAVATRHRLGRARARQQAQDARTQGALRHRLEPDARGPGPTGRQGLVHQLSQKGFRVPPLSAAHLVDITRSRQLVEVEAMKLAIAPWRCGLGGRDRHELPSARTSVSSSARRQKPDMHEFETRHQRFHRALIAACPLTSVKRVLRQPLSAGDPLSASAAALRLHPRSRRR